MELLFWFHWVYNLWLPNKPQTSLCISNSVNILQWCLFGLQCISADSVWTEDELSKQLQIHPALGHYYLLWGRCWTHWEGRNSSTACATLSFPSPGQLYHFLVSWVALRHSKWLYGPSQTNTAADVMWFVIVYSVQYLPKYYWAKSLLFSSSIYCSLLTNHIKGHMRERMDMTKHVIQRW